MSTAISLSPLTLGTAAAAVLSVASIYLLSSRCLNMRIGKQIQPKHDGRLDDSSIKKMKASSAAATVTATPIITTDERSVGLLEQWYISQRDKRCFVQTVTINTTSPPSNLPSIEQLRAAVASVVKLHPMLLILPSPTHDRIVSQLGSTLEGESYDETIARCLRKAVLLQQQENVADTDTLLLELLNQKGEEEPTQQDYEQRRTVEEWMGFKLVLVKCNREDNKVDAPSSFKLLLRMTHIVGDGLSGVAFLSMVLEELSKIVSKQVVSSSTSARATPQVLIPLASYPSMDDYIDTRPRLRRIVQHVWEELTTSKKKMVEPWLGKNIMLKGNKENGLVVEEGEKNAQTQFLRIHLPPASVKSLQTLARQHGVTLQAVLMTTAAMTCAVLASTGVSEKEETDGGGVNNHIQPIKLALFTPLNIRPLCAQSKQDNSYRGKSFDTSKLIGNFIAAHEYEMMMLSTTANDVNGTPAAAAATFWSISTHYLTSLRSSLSHSLDTLGLLTLVDIDKYIEQREMKFWEKRNGSTEVSNLGVVEMDMGMKMKMKMGGKKGKEVDSSSSSSSGSRSNTTPTTTTTSPYTLAHIEFIQPAHYLSPVFVNSVVSCTEGGLTNLVSYSTRVVDKRTAGWYREIYEALLAKIGEGEDPTLHQACEMYHG